MLLKRYKLNTIAFINDNLDFSLSLIGKVHQADEVARLSFYVTIQIHFDYSGKNRMFNLS